MPDQPTPARGRTKSNAVRASEVETAATALREVLPAALADPSNVKAWELVERHGATIHRQARLLAGKSKGG